MALTITEADDVNTLLRWLFGIRQPGTANIDDQDHADKAEDAAARLADAAAKKLMAGLRGNDVHGHWCRVEACPWHDDETMEKIEP